MQYFIVQAQLEHVDMLAPLFDAYRQFYQQQADLDGARSFLYDRLASGESTVLLALSDGEGPLMGLGFVQLYPSFSSVSMRRLWILNDLFVMPTVRQRGIATALLQHARDLASATGASALTLATAVDNFNAQQLYESLGYQRNTQFYHYTLALPPE